MNASTQFDAGATWAWLLSLAQESLHERFGAGQWQGEPTTLTARKSTMLLLRSRPGGPGAVLKLYHEAEAARMQAAALRRAAAGMSGGGFDVPALYAEYPETNALLLEWVPARHLEQVLVRAAVSPRRHWEAVRGAGAWLQRFHALAEPAPAPFEAARYASQLEGRLRTAPAAAARMDRDPLWRSARARLDAGLARLQGRAVPTTVTHGDFTSTNLLIGPGRVTGIDLWGERRAPVADDLARMFVYLAMGDVLPLDGRLRPVPLERWRAMRALRAGYGQDLAQDPELWRVVVLFETMARALALGERLARRRSFTETWKQSGLRALLRVLVRD